MKKIAFIGCGGINSWAIKDLHNELKVYEKDEMVYVKLFDNDVVEEKNLLRQNQNFKVEDLMMEKAEVLGKRYNYDYECVFITNENLNLLDTFDDIIIGVDSHKVRQMLYQYCLDNNKYFLDMRTQGRQFSAHVKDSKKDMEYYNKKYFSNPKVMERKGSCQLTQDIENDNLQRGNYIIARFGISGLYLLRLKGEQPATYEYRFII